MGASRKLQGEIDRVLKKVQEGVDVFDSIWNKVYDTDNANQKEKFEADLKKEIKKLQRYRDQIKTWIQSSEIKDKKVSASYEQALIDSRKLIEREMERFKVCEKEFKTKAFSKEGLGQQPKTDPKEKAKSETRDWLNNLVSELESQIDNFEAEMEGLSVKKGKTRPPRLTHLETSIVRHKAHIMKLELILRLLDNDELSPEQVNDIRDFLEDYVERNQEDFDEFSDVDELYSTLPLDKVESLEDLVALGTPALVKGVTSVPNTGAVLGLKTSLASSATQLGASLPSTAHPVTPNQEQADDTASQDSNSDVISRTPPPKNGMVGSSVASPTSAIVYGAPGVNNMASPAGNITARSINSELPGSAALPTSVRGTIENASATASQAPIILYSVKEDTNVMSPGQRPSPALVDIGLAKGVARGSDVGSSSLVSGNGIPSDANPVGGAMLSDATKRNILGAEERIGNGGIGQPIISSLGDRVLLQQASRASDGIVSTESSNFGDETSIGGRGFSPLVVPGAQWRPHNASSFQNPNEMGQFRGRTEIVPDQREKFLQRLQQVQQGHSALLGMSHLPGANQKQFLTQQQSSLSQQNSSLSPQVALALGVDSPSGLSAVSSSSMQNAVYQLPAQHALMSVGPKDADAAHVKVEDEQLHHNPSEDLSSEPVMNAGLSKNPKHDNDLKSPYPVDSPAGASESSTEATHVPRDVDLSPGQPLQLNQASLGLGVIGRRSVSDLGAIGDNLSGSTANFGGIHDQLYNLQMLEAAFYKLPQPKDSERPKNYIPRHPAKTPPSYPQVQAPIVQNPLFWERLSIDPLGTDTLFFAFYFQQNTYQQYLAARELKKQSWRYHRKYNTWFQRHEEPKVTTDEYEQGTYVYFDFHIVNDDLQRGWCQRIKTEFTFEYSYLEDELVV